MFQLRYTKLKRVFVSFLLPRVLLKDTKLYNRAAVALEHFSKVRKSTDSGNNEEQMRIIEKCFGKNLYENEVMEKSNKDKEKSNEVYEKNIITPEFYNVTRSKPRYTLFSKLLGAKSKNDTELSSKTEDKNREDTKLQATTSKLTEEKLEQKVEVVDETPHVEAHAPKVEGFNLPPKVLGNDSFILELSKKKGDNEQLDFDEIAKRCLGAPSNDIDKMLLQELKNFNKKNSQPRLDMDLASNQFVEKSFGLSENDQIPSNYDIKIMNNEYRFDRIQPVHLDSTPLLKTDDEIKEFKDMTLIREFSTIYFTTDVDDTVSDTPAPLSPYENPMPFYEYVNKGITAPEHESGIETPTKAEELQETEIIFHDEAHQREAIEQERSRIEEVEIEQPLNPKPNVTQFSESLKAQATEIKDTLCQKLTQGNFLNVFAFQRFFTSTPDQPSGWFPDDAGQRSEQHNTAISATLKPGRDTRNLEIPSDTAISANQNPDEYYKMSFPDEFVINDQTKPLESIFAESPVTQNVIFSALPQQLELEEANMENKTTNAQLRKDPISNLIAEPTSKRDTTIHKVIQPDLVELSKKNVTEGVPLSQLLKRIREQNRLEYCRDLFAKTDIKLDKNKKFACPPIDKKSKTCEKPCETKPKPACEQIKPCPPPTKKDPCAKFSPIFLTLFKCDIPLDIFQKPYVPSLNCFALITADVIERLNALGQRLRYISKDSNDSDEMIYAREFDPWVPIPSWPIPKKEKARPFVCPKEGCKIALPKITKQPYKGKQCLEAPKKNYAVSRLTSPFNIYYVDYPGNV